MSHPEEVMKIWPEFILVGPIVYLTLESKEQLPDEEKKEGCKLYRSASYFFL